MLTMPHGCGSVEGHARVTPPPRPVCWGGRLVSLRLLNRPVQASAISTGAGVESGAHP